MEVVAHLSPPLLSHLRTLVPREHRLTWAEDWGAFERLIRRTAADVAVVDPAANGSVRTDEIVDLTRRYPSLPIVVYTTLSAPSLRAIVELAKQGVHQVVLYRFDDDPRRFVELLEQQPGVALSDDLIRLLAAPLSGLPSTLARAIERMFQRPGRFTVAEDLATAAGMPRRTLYRVLMTSGFASPSTLVRGARLLRAYAYLRDTGHSAEDVAVKLGYSSRQLFARHVRDFFGVRPTELRRRMSEEECVRRLAAALHGDGRLVDRSEAVSGGPPSPPTGTSPGHSTGGP